MTIVFNQTLDLDPLWFFVEGDFVPDSSVVRKMSLERREERLRRMRVLFSINVASSTESEFSQKARILWSNPSHAQESRSGCALPKIVSDHYTTGKRILETVPGWIHETSSIVQYRDLSARVPVASSRRASSRGASSRGHADLSTALWAALKQILASISYEVQSCRVS